MDNTKHTYSGVFEDKKDFSTFNYKKALAVAAERKISMKSINQL